MATDARDEGATRLAPLQLADTLRQGLWRWRRQVFSDFVGWRPRGNRGTG